MLVQIPSWEMTRIFRSSMFSLHISHGAVYRRKSIMWKNLLLTSHNLMVHPQALIFESSPQNWLPSNHIISENYSSNSNPMNSTHVHHIKVIFIEIVKGVALEGIIC